MRYERNYKRTGWMTSVYCTDHCFYLVRGYLCGTENRSQWFFYGDYTVR